jgi:hypothetical protein
MPPPMNPFTFTTPLNEVCYLLTPLRLLASSLFQQPFFCPEQPEEPRSANMACHFLLYIFENIPFKIRHTLL